MIRKGYLKLLGVIALVAFIVAMMVWSSGMYRSAKTNYFDATNQCLNKATETELTIRLILAGDRFEHFFRPYPKDDTSKYVTKRIVSEDTTIYVRFRKDEQNVVFSKIRHYMTMGDNPVSTQRLDSIFKCDMAESGLSIIKSNIQYIDLKNDNVLESSAPEIKLTQFNIVSNIDTLDITKSIGAKAYVQTSFFAIMKPVMLPFAVALLLTLVALFCACWLIRDLVRLYRLGFKFLWKLSRDTEKKLKKITGGSLDVVRKKHQKFEDNEETQRMNKTYDQINDEASNSGRFWVYMNNEDGKVQLERCAVEIKQSLLELKDDFEEIEDKKVTVTVKCPDDLILVTDEIFFQRIVRELMRNSARYSDHEVHIDVTAEEKKEPKVIVITVRDNGWGIPKNDIESVFKFGYQVMDHVMRIGDDEGMGLGLPFVESFTSALGGAINISSFDGQFTQVQLIFPITPDDEITTHIYRKNVSILKENWESEGK